MCQRVRANPVCLRTDPPDIGGKRFEAFWKLSVQSQLHRSIAIGAAYREIAVEK